VFSFAVAQNTIAYHAVWPAGPSRDSVPAWAAPGKVRFSRWDGGRIETAKAMLSGWAGLNPTNPDLLYTMTNWYALPTVRLLREAHINLIWVTLSVGYSNESEAAHRADVARYIAECHRQGIHVLAYESVANLFWEDMFAKVPASENWVAKGRDGKPLPYGSGHYELMGRTTRYMANLANPEWRTYLNGRVDLAIESGADGLIFDNGSGDQLFDLYPALMQYAAGRKHDFLMMANINCCQYALNRSLNSITTEDGLEPGLWSSKSPGYERLRRHYEYLMPVADKLLVNNTGLLRIHETLAEGWKPAVIEDGQRETAHRLLALMSPSRSQLALAENMMYGIGLEQFIEARPAHELITGRPEAVASWRAIGKYNQFFEEHAELYTGARSRAPLAIVLDDRTEGVPLLDGLGARRVLFNVLYERDVTVKALSGYRAVAMLTARVLRQSAITAIEQFARSGGTLVTVADCGVSDETGQNRAVPPFAAAGSGKSIHLERLPAIDELARVLQQASGAGVASLQAPPGILYNVTESADSRRVLVHLLNFTLEPVAGLELRVEGTYRSARLLSPDGPGSFAVPPQFTATHAGVSIPGLRIYSVVVLDRK
jgi:hypothetical protein